ncbi:dienelactone hydrolase family protein [Piscinibacter sakaiensis]|uniref:dienelactone hydrolase family protein n=1 Tax=Piscinibacter sakaiensis TaxID=1547922 RepID=UPI003AAE20D0
MSDEVVKAEWAPIADGGFDGWLALPPAGSGPGLLLWQEVFGVNAHIRRVAEQYALAGFVVLAPDIFWREERRLDLGYEGADRERGRAIAQALQREQLQADIRASVDALRSHPACAGKRVGTIGYCLGGRLAYQTAAWATVDAAVAYYGGGIQDQLGLLPEISAPLQFHYAGRDHHIPQAAIEQVRTAVGNAGEVFVYPEAQHGFNCWARSTYDPASAALAHGRSLVFLADKLF